jgi:hypothetical protein
MRLDTERLSPHRPTVRRNLTASVFELRDDRVGFGADLVRQFALGQTLAFPQFAQPGS